MRRSILNIKRIFSIALFAAVVLIPFKKINAQVMITAGGKFKDWNYSQSSVFGLAKLANADNRTYYTISKIDLQTTIVREHSPSGIVVNTTVVRFFNGKLKLITFTNQWGDTHETMNFKYIGNETFTVTDTQSGVNGFLPCKSALYIFKNNLLSEVRHLDYSGRLCNNSDGVAVVQYIRYTDPPRFSLIKEQSFYDTNVAPAISKSDDCYKIIYERDASGNDISQAFYGIHDESVTNRYRDFKIIWEYDDNDNCIKREEIGLNEQIILNSDSVAQYRYTYENGLLMQETRYDDRNNVCRASAVGDGIAIVKYQYDGNGNNILRTYYDETGAPINSHNGYQKVVYTFSPLNMLIKLEFFDKYQAAALNPSGIHEYIALKDDKNRLIQQSYFDKDNNPVKNGLDEVYMEKIKYDEFGRVISRSYWKDDVTKMARWNGYHEYMTRYNDDGQETELLYYDENGNLFKTDGGYSRLLEKYDTDGRWTGLSYFDNNTPVMVSGKGMVINFQSIKFFYDSNGRQAGLEYFDDAGNPANAAITMVANQTFNCHKIEFVYQGNRIIQENCYLANSDAPAKIIDCLKNDYVDTNGLRKGFKNQ